MLGEKTRVGVLQIRPKPLYLLDRVPQCFTRKPLILQAVRADSDSVNLGSNPSSPAN